MSRQRVLTLTAAAVLTAAVAVGGVQLTRATGGGTATSVVPVEPYRILDTRNGTGAPTAPIPGGSTIDVQIAGVGPVPTDAVGVVLNVTGTRTTEPTYVTAWPTGTTMPTASVLNLTPGIDAPNSVTALLGDGQVSFFNFNGATDLIADVAAYLVPAGESSGAPGPPGPTAAGFAVSDHWTKLATPGTPFHVSQLIDLKGSGKLVVDFPTRLAVTSSIQLSITGSGQRVEITCELQVSDGGPYQTIGEVASAVYTAPGAAVLGLPVNAMADRPPGTYDVRVTCINLSGPTQPQAFVQSLNVTAIAR